VFACLFAMYAVLGRNYAGGPTGAELFDLPLVAVNTALLLLSSITYGFAMLEMQGRPVGWDARLAGGHGVVRARASSESSSMNSRTSFTRARDLSAAPFLSSFFALVGTHGLHVTFGLVWLVTLLVQLSRHGSLIPEKSAPIALSFHVSWHFLDVVWIGVFTFVYLMGVLP